MRCMLFCATALSFFVTTGAQACVGGFIQNGSHLLVNNCPYPVLVKFRASNGYEGTAGPIRPGGSELTGVGSRQNMQWWFCNVRDWNRGSCRL